MLQGPPPAELDASKSADDGERGVAAGSDAAAAAAAAAAEWRPQEWLPLGQDGGPREERATAAGTMRFAARFLEVTGHPSSHFLWPPEAVHAAAGAKAASAAGGGAGLGLERESPIASRRVSRPPGNLTLSTLGIGTYLGDADSKTDKLGELAEQHEYSKF